jgi:hypothetical protein
MKKSCRTLLSLLILGAIVSVGITVRKAERAALRLESGIMSYPPPSPEPPIEPDKIAG